jgi:O-antigen/teichoic acid export membrane protein
VVFIYTLDNDLNGYFQSLHSFATLLVPLLGFGIQGAIVKYYPIFVQKKLESHFLSFTLVIATISAFFSSIILALLYWLFSPLFKRIFLNFALVEDNKFSILALGLIFLYSSIFLYHAIARFRIVIPDIINNIGLKLFLPILILVIFFGYIERSYFVLALISYFSLVGIALFIYLMRLDKHSFNPSMSSLSHFEYKGLFAFMMFSVLNGVGATFALKIDIAMIGVMISKESVGIYAIIMNISNVMDIPSKAINQIASPVISRSWANDERDNIQDIYQKSSLYGLIGGIFLFLLLFFIWNDILMLMPGKMNINTQTVLYIFTFLGIAKITDLITGVNSVIISFSKDYKFHMYFLLLLGGVNVILNYLFIYEYGLIGAAAATCISYILFNVLKHVFVRKRFGFTLTFHGHLLVVLIGIIVFAVLYFLRFEFHPIINMVLKSAITAILFLMLIWKFNPGDDIRNLINNSVKNYFGFIFKFRK